MLCQTAAAVVPMDAPVTVENIMALLNEYDPDGAFAVQFGIDNGSDVLQWFHEENRITANLAVWYAGV